MLGPGLMVLAMLIVLAGLGTWQVERLFWKQQVLAEVARAEAAAPVPLGPDPLPFTKVKVDGTFRHDRIALYGAEVKTFLQGPLMGGRMIVVLERPGARPVLIDRGWVPERSPTPIDQPTGPVEITGYVHPGERETMFSAASNPAERRFFTLDARAIGAALGAPDAEPWVIVALGPRPASGWPDPAHALPRPPNNHLMYVITWYGLAAGLIAVFFVWIRRETRT